jgi:hypothetical protein
MKHSSVNSNMIGVALGGLLGLLHLGWATLVAIGLAQPFLDTIAQLHMIKMDTVVTAFSVNHAIGLVLVASGIGYILGYLFGLVWNSAQKA